jgi:hypothetical protein
LSAVLTGGSPPVIRLLSISVTGGGCPGFPISAVYPAEHNSGIAVVSFDLSQCLNVIAVIFRSM